MKEELPQKVARVCERLCLAWREHCASDCLWRTAPTSGHWDFKGKVHRLLESLSTLGTAPSPGWWGGHHRTNTCLYVPSVPGGGLEGAQQAWPNQPDALNHQLRTSGPSGGQTDPKRDITWALEEFAAVAEAQRIAAARLSLPTSKHRPGGLGE